MVNFWDSFLWEIFATFELLVSLMFDADVKEKKMLVSLIAIHIYKRAASYSTEK